MRSGDGEGKAVQNDEAGSIARGVRRIGRDFDRLIAAAIVQVSIESQTAESRVAKLPVLEPGVLDHKLYVRGVGTVREQTVKGGIERNVLVSLHRP